MPEITPQELEEYQMLQRYHRRQLELESIQGLTLEQDIDAPIKKCVMAFALLGCGPIWSCCGFDYYGQPIHKWHQYGRTYFILEYNDNTRKTLEDFSEIKGWWNVGKIEGAIDLHVSFFNPVTQWDDRECVYYYEPASVNIASLEGFLLVRKDDMIQEIVLRDSSKIAIARYPSWQYPPRGDWIIRRDDLYV